MKFGCVIASNYYLIYIIFWLYDIEQILSGYFHVPKAIKVSTCNCGNKNHNVTIAIFDSNRNEIFNKSYQVAVV